MRKNSVRCRLLWPAVVLPILGVGWTHADAGSTTWIYEAETSPRGWSEAAVTVKDPDASGGLARVSRPAISRRGNVAFACPMTMEQPPGNYRVVFRLKVEDNTNPDPVAKLNVWQEGLGNVVSSEVKASEFAAVGKYQDFPLEFTRAPGGLVACSITALAGYGDTPEPIGTTTWYDKVTFEQVRAFTAAEIRERFPQSWQPQVLHWPAHQGPLRVLVVRGPQAPWFRVEEAAALLPLAEIRRSNFGITISSGDYQITGSFPQTREELFQFDVVVLLDVDAFALRVQRRQMLADFVRAGGGLLVCGGPYAYGRGRYVGTELEDVLPVSSDGPWDWKSAPSPISPAGKHEITSGIKWKPAPEVLWYHAAKVRPRAKVVLKAGKDPLLIVGTTGKGRSAALLATALGKSAAPSTPFWDWPAWQQTMANTLRWLAGRKLSAAISRAPDGATTANEQLIIAETTANRIPPLQRSRHQRIGDTAVPEHSCASPRQAPQVVRVAHHQCPAPPVRFHGARVLTAYLVGGRARIHRAESFRHK